MSEIIETNWSSEPAPRMRRQYLIAVKDGKVYSFTGESVPGVLAVKASRYHKNGKWSGTRYVLQHRDTTQVLAFAAHFDTAQSEDGLAKALRCDPTWEALTSALGVSEEALRGALSDKARARLDDKRDAAASL